MLCSTLFFFNDAATTEIYTLSLHDALPISVLHFGTHGALEFMPGKHTGLSGACWPDRLLGSLPNFYFYASNNPSEGSIAKRRSAATLISYLTPSITEAGLYKGLHSLKASLDQYRSSAPEASAERERLLDVIRVQAEDLDLSGDTAGLSTDGFVQHLVNAITETEYALIPHGLHVAGRGMEESERTETLAHIAAAMPETKGIADASGLCRLIVADAAAALQKAVLDLDDQARETVRHLKAINDNLRSNEELDGLVRALDASFVPPAPSGDLLRTPDLLPTGRNLHGFDPFGIPSKFALEDGARQAARILDRHLKGDGKLPETVAIVLWGTDNLKTGGAPLAQAMALMGARPRLDSYNRVCGDRKSTRLNSSHVRTPRMPSSA